MKKTFVLVFLFSFIIWTSSAEEIIFATEESAPFNFISHNSVIGITADQIQMLIKNLNLKAQIKIYPWSRVYKMGLNEKNVCIFPAARTEEREKKFKWTGALISNKWVFLSLNPQKINSLDDVKTENIGAYIDDAIATFLKNKKFNVQEVAQDELNALKLKKGRIHYWATTYVSGLYMAKKNNVKVFNVLEFNEKPLAIACNKNFDDKIFKKINLEIEKIHRKINLENLILKYTAEHSFKE